MAVSSSVNVKEPAASQARPGDGAPVPGQIPLIFGVTGHRDLRPQDIPVLEERVREIFRDFQRRYPATPLTLLSPLAEGADRLVARVALECGVRLAAPLPMPRALYVTDFETADSRDEFDDLLGRAAEWFELPLVAGNTAEGLAGGAAGREWQYAQVGLHIVRRCQVLIALWDGVPSDKVGGTAEVVRLRATGAFTHSRDGLLGLPRRGHLDPVESGPVFHVVTPRVCTGTVPAGALTLRREFHPREEDSGDDATATHARKNAEATDAYERIYDNLDSYNRSALLVERTPRLGALRTQSEGYLMPADEARRLGADLWSLRACHAAADVLAQRFQQDTERILIFLSALVFVAASLFEMYETGHDPRFLLCYPLFLGVVYAGWAQGVKKVKWQDKYQDYRALAEGLRVAFFWRLIGQNVPVADHYLNKQRSEIDWIRIAIQNAGGAESVHGTAGTAPGDVPAEFWDLVLKHWVDDQSRYFARSAIPKNERMLEGTERRVKGLLLGSQIIPAVLAFLLLLPLGGADAGPEGEASFAGGIEPVRHWLERGMHEHVLVALSALMAVVAGLLHTYADKKAFAQHVKQYRRMEHIFARAARRLRDYLSAQKYHHAAELILELGRESLEENGDWVLTHRERPVDVPHVG